MKKLFKKIVIARTAKARTKQSQDRDCFALRARNDRKKSGSILVLTVVLLVGIIGILTLTLDSWWWMANKHGMQNVADNMSLAAIDCYYNNPVLNDILDDPALINLPLQEEIGARMIAGIRCAYNVYRGSDNIIFDQNKMGDPITKLFSPFANFDWHADYQQLLIDLQAQPRVSHAFPTFRYAVGALKFRDTSGTDIFPNSYPFNPTLGHTVVFQSATDFSHKFGQGVNPILSKIIFRSAAASRAEVVNLGITRSVVLAMDRSTSMYKQTKGPSNTYVAEHWIQVGNNTIQPMQDLVYAAQILPGILHKQNRYRDPTLNNSFGVVLFDTAAEALDLNPGNPNTHLDHGANAYSESVGQLSVSVMSQKIPRLNPDPYKGQSNFTNALRLSEYPNHLKSANCKDHLPNPPFSPDNPNPNTTSPTNHYRSQTTPPAPLITPSPDPCRHDTAYGIDNFKAEWARTQNIYGSKQMADLWAVRPIPPAGQMLALDSFFPHTQTDGSVGLEVAIEMIRQERLRFVTATGQPISKFQGEIVMLSDAQFNTFHDRNIMIDGVADRFPFINFPGPGFEYNCDNNGILNTGRSVALPNNGSLFYDDILYPVSWRKRVSQPVAYDDIYHSGNTVYYIPNATANPKYDPINNPKYLNDPQPLGIETVTNTSIATLLSNNQACGTPGAPNCCPGPECQSMVTSCGHLSPQSSNNNGCSSAKQYDVPINNQYGASIHCADKAVMEYALWAEANGIIIDALGFQLPPAAGANRTTRLFLLNYLTDPSNDGQDVGLLFIDVDCSGGTSGNPCPQVKKAFSRIGNNIRVRLSA